MKFPISLRTLPANERVFAWRDHASLWFSLGVGLLVMQMGAFLIPALGIQAALCIIILGSLLGAGLLGWVARLGCETGLSSAGLMCAVYGRWFAVLPILLNIVQLVGWGSFELVVMRDATLAIGQSLGVFQSGLGPWSTTSFWSFCITVCWGALLMLLMAGPMVVLVRKVLARVALPLVIISLLWLSVQFIALAQSGGWQLLWNRAGQGGMAWFSALDLVIAMPVSWLPLVADYARHGKNGRGAFYGTGFGYAVANIWCYSLGLLVAVTLPGNNFVVALLLAQGGLLALSLILIDEVDNAYGDVYSGAVSSNALFPRMGVRRWGFLLILLCTGFAVFLPMHELEPFLLLLSSVFVPLFGALLASVWNTDFVAQRQSEAPIEHAIAPAPVAGWLAGIGAYYAVPYLTSTYALPAFGQTLPALVVSCCITRCLQGWQCLKPKL